MGAVVLIEAVAIALLFVIVGGLLRSHADILRALHRLGVDLDGGVAVAPPRSVAGGRPGAGALATGDGRAAADLTGRSASDEAVRIAVGSVRHDTLLAFLTTGCATCATFWQALGAPGLAVPGDARVVIVAHDPAEESVSRVRSMAPRRVPVVMSSAAWEDYGVAYAPYFVYVSGPQGRVLGEGVAGTWDDLTSLLGQALADRGARADAGEGAAGAGTTARSGREQDRAERVDDDLRRAGILPGDPQLYPARLDTAPPPAEGGRGPGTEGP